MIDRATPRDFREIEIAPHQAFDQTFREILGKPSASDWVRAYARTVWIQDERIAILGITPMHLGCAEVWHVLGPNWEKFSVVITRHHVRLIQLAVELLSLNRVQAGLHAGNMRSLRMLERLGFEFEGVLKSYHGPGEDCWMMGKTI